MAFYDKEKLIEDADALTVAEYLNVEVKRMGSGHSIRCPGHLKEMGKEDNRFGNCYLTPKGYRCFGCNKTVSLVNMVMEIEDCNYNEALGLIGDAMGGRQYYIINGNYEDEKPKEKLLKDGDLEILGLLSSVSFDDVRNLAFSKKEIEDLNKTLVPDLEGKIKSYSVKTINYEKNGEEIVAYLSTKHETISLKSLEKEEPEVFYSMIKNKAEEAIQKYTECLETICNKEHKHSLMLMPISDNNISVSDEVMFNVSNYYRQCLRRAKEIANEITPEMTGEKQVEKEFNFKDEVNKINNALDLDIF